MSLTGLVKTPRCCGQTINYNIPSPPQNLVILELTGYNYRTIPEWFDSTGQKMMSLQFGIEYDKLRYVWSFYKREDEKCGKDGDLIFHLSTSDDIFPTVRELISGTKMKVKRISLHNGYTSWRVWC